MKTKERELANKIAAHWYDNLHMQHAPIFQKQKLADFVESELKTLGLFSVSGWAYIRKHLKPILIGLATGITLMSLFSLIENIVLKLALIIHGG